MTKNMTINILKLLLYNKYICFLEVMSQEKNCKHEYINSLPANINSAAISNWKKINTNAAFGDLV